MKSRDGKSQREEKKKEDQKRESLRRKKIQVREKVGKSRSRLCFPKRRVRSHLARCGLHAVVARSTFPSQNAKAPGVRTTFGSCDVEKVHAVVARSTFRSQNVQNTPCSDHFWKLRCRKSARRCGAKHISKSKCKTLHVRTTFGRSDVVSRGRRKGLCTLSKVSKT